MSLQFSFDVFVNQNQYYNGFPTQATTPLRSGCGTPNQTSGFYNCPFGLAASTRP
jgi:hypothetical protein